MARSSAEPTEASSAETKNRRWNIALYATVSFLFWTGLYLYVPTLPTYVKAKSDTLAQVGLVLSMYGLWQGIIRLPLGIAADWLGWRKPFILLGLATVGLGAWLLSTSQTVSALIVGRAITGLGAGTWVLIIVSFGSLFPPGEVVRATAMVTLFGAVGRAFVTATTGWLNELGGYSLPFLLAVGSATLAFFLILPAGEKRSPRRQPSLGSVTRLISRRDILLPALLNAFLQYGNYTATMSFLPVLAKELGATDVALGLLLSLNMGVAALGNLTVTTIVKRVGARRLVYLAFLALLLGLGGASLAPTIPWVYVSQCFIGLAFGIGYPTLMGLSIQHVEGKERSTALGLHQAVYSVGMFAGPWLSGMLADALGLRPMFAITGVLCSSIGIYVASRLAQREETSSP